MIFHLEQPDSVGIKCITSAKMWSDTLGCIKYASPHAHVIVHCKLNT